MSLYSPEFGQKLASCYENYDAPVLVYDFERIHARVEETLKFSNRYNCRFLVAVKSLPASPVLSFFAKCGIGFDISNDVELRSVVSAITDAGAQSVFITASGPKVLDIETFDRVSALTLGSLKSVERYLAASSFLGELGLRVQVFPDMNNLSQPGSSRFGIPFDELGEAVRLIDPDRVMGLHCHLAIKSSADDFVALGRALMAAAERSNIRPRFFNLGGSAADFDVQQLEAAIAQLRTFIPTNIELIFEFGSYWFRNAGWALGRVVDMQNNSTSEISVTLDLSRECHLKWSRPQLVVPRGTGATNEVIVFGSTCYEGDVIGRYTLKDNSVMGQQIDIGTILIFSSIDGYAAAWNTPFNGVEKAKVVFHGI